MLRIALCDDEKSFINFEKKIIDEIETDDIKEIDCFTKADQFLKVVEEKFYDIIFLDVDMPDVDGFMIADRLNIFTNKTILVFVTSLEHVAIEGYKYNAFRFIRKQDFSKEIYPVFHDALKRISENEQVLQLKYRSETFCLKYESIYYLISLNNYVLVKLLDKDLKFRMEFSKMKAKLLRSTFALVNRGIMVNCEHIIKIDGKNQTVYLKNGEFIKASKSGLDNVKKKMMESI